MQILQVVSLLALPLAMAFIVQMFMTSVVYAWVAGCLGLAIAIGLYVVTSKGASSLQRACKYAESLAEDMSNFSAVTNRGDEGTRIYKALQALSEVSDEGGASQVTDTDANLLQMKSALLNSLRMNVMVADDNDNLIFVNDASYNAFHELADDIREVYSEFDPDKAIGASIHNFHKDPEIIKKVLRNMKEGDIHKARIKVGTLVFSLNVAPIFVNGERKGTFAEWANITEQLASEEQAEKVLSCIKGLNSNVMMADEEDNLVFANDASVRAFHRIADDIRKVYPKFDPEKVIGASIHNFHKDPDAIRTVLHSLKEGEVHRADIKVGSLTLSLNVGGVFSNGKRMGTFAEWADVTHQRKSEQEKVRVENQIEHAAKAINTATRDIAQGNTNLSERTEAQAASIEETTASMQQITERVNNNAQNSKEALTSANDTRQAADRGGEVVRSAIQAMGEISESSSKINDIIGVIDEIAFQTNLLALNAAVEAARAGEQGRGFAVVASEVRTLAGRSSKAAKEIKSLITESVQKVKAGTEQVNQTGSCLNDIISNVTKVTDMVGGISEASQEQALSIQEINKTIAQMDTFTQQNAALVEEASAASKALEEQAVGLIDLISETESTDDIKTPDMEEINKPSSENVEVREY